MKKVFSSIFRFALINFGPMVVFYTVNHFFDFKTGVLVSISFTFVEFIWLKYKQIKPTLFFYLTSTLVVVFGILDLTLTDPIFFKFESPIINLVLAAFFGISLLKEKSLIQEIAETQGKTTKDQSPDKTFFFRLYTYLWTLYYIGRAGAFLWINLQNNLSDGFLIRLLVGKVSFWIMIFVSVGIPRYVWRMLWSMHIFPSQRTVSIKSATANNQEVTL